MKRNHIRLIAVVITVLLLCCTAIVPAAAADASITYSFEGGNASDKGYAQGALTVRAGSTGGTYYLYWADDAGALDGFDPICVLSVASGGSASFTLPEFTAIPAKATKVLGFLSSSVPTDLRASAAQAGYAIPATKALAKTDGDLLYSFASYSDTHVCSNEEGSNTIYPYDEEHLLDAFNTAAARDVDFIVTTGDHVNNQRADAKGGANPFYPEEWNTYLRILAASDYANPIYEAIGNHELWCYDTESDYSNKDWRTGSDYFCAMTGLDATQAALSSGKAYFEMTEPVTGDHFLFMALEGGFYTDRVDEFTDEQIDWLGGKLAQYENDGKNVFILEHANFYKWGSGDQLDNPIYNIPLKDGNLSTGKLKALLKRYKNAVMITGHTHFKFDLQLNYSTNSATSATMIHNSSVGGVRDIENHTKRVNDISRENCEGYIVEVYSDATVFYGTNLYYNRVNPSATYIVPQTTSAINEPTEVPTEAPTQAQTEAPTVAPTEAPTEPPVTFLRGDADGDGDVNIIDATFVQRYDIGILLLTPINEEAADVDGDGSINIIDATFIQRYVLGILTVWPADAGKNDIAAVSAAAAPAETGGDLAGLRSQVQNALDKYWLLASYDQYQALKKAYQSNAGYDALSAAYSTFNIAADSYYPGDMVDVYFSNNLRWEKVYAYCSAGHGKDKNAKWPGEEMEYVKTNSYGEKIYKISVPVAKYNFIVFDDGSGNQTVDLPLGVTQNRGFYYDAGLGIDGEGHYRCSAYVYGN